MSKIIEQVKKVKSGKIERYSFGRVPQIIPDEDFLDLPKSSYKKFIEHGIGECFKEFSPIIDFSGKAYLYFVDYHLVEKDPFYNRQECKRKGINYCMSLRAKFRLVITETGEAKEEEVFLGDIPKMTEDGAFIYNGVERVIVNQIVRSPGVYFTSVMDTSGKFLYSGQMIPTRGIWIEFEQNNADNIKMVLDRGSKISIVTFMKCFGYSNEEIVEIFGNNRIVLGQLEKEELKLQEECLVELAKKMRPNDVPDANATLKYLNDRFFGSAYYNLARIGRYKFNKKLNIATRIKNQISANNIKVGKKIIVTAGEKITPEMAEMIRNSAINVVEVVIEGVTVRVVGNNQVSPARYLGLKEGSINFKEEVYLPNLLAVVEGVKTKEEMVKVINDNEDKLVSMQLTMDDILSGISYALNIDAGLGETDNIDNLCNRRISSAGELLHNAFRSGVSRLSTSAKESMQSQDMENLMPSTVLNARPLNKAMRDFIASPTASQLSQLMDQVNPISGLTQKRKLSAVGPGGVSKERAGADIRDIHETQYGRICAIETPEGQSIGLINSFACYAKVDDYGFIMTPYRIVDAESRKLTNDIVYLTADEEQNHHIAQATIKIDENGILKSGKVLCRYNDEILDVDSKVIDYVDVAPNQLISVATSLIPFVEHNEAARALMGSNMQRQAVPLITTESPIVGTGLEAQVARDSGAIVTARNAGVVEYVDAETIKVRRKSQELDIYELIKFEISNNKTCSNQKPAVVVGEKVKEGDLLADGYSTKDGELALGKDMLVAYMGWEGYNYEDAILISERISREDIFTSITLNIEELKCRSTKLGDEEITRDIPNLSEEATKNLDEFGIIRVGADVLPGDILVGKVTPKGETEATPEERLLRAIFGEKSRDVRDTSLRVQHGQGGVVVDVQVFAKKNNEKYNFGHTYEEGVEFEPGVNLIVKVLIAQKRKLSVGDKMSGRYGNKGIVSKILPIEDMPYMADGRAVDILLSPLGVASRMNLGQLFETHLGLVAHSLGWKVFSPCFDGATADQIQQLLVENNFPADGKVTLYDGRTGLAFDNKVTVGYKYMVKLDHMVDSKMHARSTGPYALVTQQPLGGKAMFGGQRFGEMEVWALYAYGAAHILQEMLTVKSDDVVGRNKTYESIILGKPITEPGVPESFKVLIKEFQGLCLDVTILNESKQEVSLNHLSGDEQDNMNIVGKDGSYHVVDVIDEEAKIVGDTNIDSLVIDDNLNFSFDEVDDENPAEESEQEIDDDLDNLVDEIANIDFETDFDSEKGGK